MPLIECHDGEFKPNIETLKWISAHKRKFGVIACGGKYRTGKSFLLNRLSECSSEDGFGVGDTIQACTKGLWICKHFFRANDELDVLFVDTEGIDALDATDDNDVRIFTLALLLSSLFVYNSVGAIDEAALNTLSLMTRVTESIKTNNMDPNELSMHMPAFHWILRDFSLKIEDKQGNALKPDEYLEHSLMLPSNVKPDDVKSGTRRAIVNNFKERHLHIMPRPASENDVCNLTGKPWLITARFHEAVEELRCSLFKNIKPVTTQNNTALTGNMYAKLCEFMCSNGKSKLPMIRDTWTMMASIQSRDLADSLIDNLRNEVSSWVPDVYAVLEEKAKQIKSEYKKKYENECLSADSAVLQQYEKNMSTILSEAVDKFGIRIEELIAEEVAKMNDKIAKSKTSDVLTFLKERFSAVPEQTGIQQWKNEFYDMLQSQWLDQLSQKVIKEEDRTKDNYEHEISGLKSTLQNKESMFADKTRDESIRFTQLTDELESLKNQLQEEKKNSDGYIVVVNTLRSQIEELSAAPQTLQSDTKEDDDEKNELCKSLEALLSSTTDERDRQIVEINEKTQKIEDLETKIMEFEEKITNLQHREKTMTEKWTVGLAELKKEAEANKASVEEKCISMKKEISQLNAKTADHETTILDKDAMIERLKEEKDRECRQAMELAERNRISADQSQERVMTMHKSMLEDLKARDERLREMHVKFSTEQIEYQTKYTDTVCNLEVKTAEITNLKKRNSTLERADEECKRLRVSVQDMSSEKVRIESELQTNIRRLETITQNRDKLREENIKLENELAVLRAEKQMNEARKDI